MQPFLPRLAQSSWVAIDTEADSLHAYPEKLCLLQVGDEAGETLIDTLADVDLGPLWDELKTRELILHGADYDLRLLKKHSEFVPAALFDTMLASRLVGCRQFGLNDLLSNYLGVSLEKGPQKANWARRPLTSRMETYALNDVRYLKPLADILTKELKEKGRLEWHRESCRILIQDATQINEPDPDLVWRIKGSHQLQPKGLSVLRAIWHWREKEATAANKPPYFVLTPETMVRLAEHAVQDKPGDGLLPQRMSKRRRTGIAKAVQSGLDHQQYPQRRRKQGHRPTEAEKKRFASLEKRRNKVAENLDMDPTLIASRATLLTLARDWEQYQSNLMNWQRELLNSTH